MSKRIQPRGSVHVGQERRLIQRTTTPPAFAGFDAGRPIGMTPIEYIPRTSHPGELEVQRLDYALQATSTELAITDDGLVASYGIFGAPGCGKTHLLMYLLQQVLQIASEEPSQKFGALILDPKSALIEDVEAMVRAAGREKDLVVLNTDRLNREKTGLNVVNVDLDAYELGLQLVMAAQASGTGTSDPYWMLAWGNIFGAALELLRIDREPVTLNKLLEETITLDTSGPEPKRPIELRAERMRRELATYEPADRQDALKAISELDNYRRMKEENAETVQSIIISAYSNFQRSKYLCYSVPDPSGRSLYDSIIEDGRIVLVSFSPSDPIMARTLCTLVKNLFQRSVLGRYERYLSGRIKNYERPLVIAADEYSQVACELQGKPLGDGDFFSQSRQHGCMGLLATQSVNNLQASPLKENWKAVFSNFGAKIFMRAADNETAEEAVKLAGKSEHYVTGEGTSRSKDGLSTSRQKELRERDNLPSMVLTQILAKGDGVILGSLDGMKTSPTMHLVRVPRDYRPVAAADREGWGHAERERPVERTGA
jgi:TraM recognition site of TraD and TraG